MKQHGDSAGAAQGRTMGAGAPPASSARRLGLVSRLRRRRFAGPLTAAALTVLAQAFVAGTAMGAQISGTVYYSTTPLAGYTVHLYDSHFTVLQSATTDPYGHYAFVGVADGSYHLGAGSDAVYLGSWSGVTVAGVDRVFNIYRQKCINLLSPPCYATVPDASPLFIWDSLPEARKYSFQLNVTSSWALLDYTYVPRRFYRTDAVLDEGVEHTWQITAFDANDHYVGYSLVDFRVTSTAAAVVPPVGLFSDSLDSGEVSIGRGLLDLSGSYSTWAEGRPFGMAVEHDASGRIRGAASYTVAKDTEITMPITGRVRGTRDRITLRGMMKRSDPARNIWVVLKLDLTADTQRRQLSGRLAGRTRVNGRSSIVDSELTLAMPGDMDGTWTLDLALGQLGAEVLGQAWLTLANEREHSFTVTGRAAADGTVNLALSGDLTDPATEAIQISTRVTPLEGGALRLEHFCCRGYGQAPRW